MKAITLQRVEWEYAIVTLRGGRPVAVACDAESAASMRAETAEKMAAVESGGTGLVDLLNALGEEGWEVAVSTPSEAETTLILKRAGTRRLAKDRELQAEMVRTLEKFGL